ncbi:MAG: SWIM zinc finger family protein [Myxococcota bacterium]|jgi:uncharacterized Zn finger protein|nr:SWIM zinc finger family protein [Myxococcota bacterium]
MGYYGRGYGEWRPYVSVASRRAEAQREQRRLEKQGRKLSPVAIEGRTIAGTFWGKSWCENLEHYSDFANRLPRGRTYVKNGSVIDLQVTAGEIKALVSGSSIYKITVRVDPMPGPRWEALCQECASEIDSLVELLQGRFAKGVMERICRQGKGLFPSPAELHLSCSCPDWATLCKHVAAVLYGVGARLDAQPELLFLLRQVDSLELVSQAGATVPLSQRGPAAGRVLADEDLGALFGVELQGAAEAPARPASKKTKVTAPLETTHKSSTKVTATPAAPAATRKTRTKLTTTPAAPATTRQSSTKVTATTAVAAPPPPPTKPARPKPARCLYPGCRLARTPGDEGYCSVHGMMWRDGDIAGPGALQK